MRLLTCVLLVATTVGLSACGDDDSQSQGKDERAAPNATGPTAGAGEQSSSGGQEPGVDGNGSGGSGGSGGSEGSVTTPRERRKAERERLRSRHPTRRGDFTGANRTIYYEARSRCLAIPLRSLARSYGAPSDTPQDAAEAYAKREAPTGVAHDAAVAGCLDGINSQPALAP